MSRPSASRSLRKKAYALADRFARKYAEWLNEGYRIDAMCPSILVSGGGNFPVRKKERQNARRSSHMERYEKVMGIKRRIASIGTGGIQAGDPNALEKLEAKAKRLEDRQDMMKRANAHYRKHGTLEGFDGVDHDEAEHVRHDMERFGMSQPLTTYEGKIDIQDEDNRTLFDLDGKRYTINGGIVIVEEQ